MFIHLHVHTEYSLLDGMCRVPQLVSKTKELGMDSLAITDHGSLYGAITFYKAAKAAGIKPIIGCEVYVAEGSRQNRSANDKSSFHLTLLAKNERGYQNLIQLVTRANLEGFYYKPRVDKEILGLYKEGLIALSGCLQGQLPRLILQGRWQDAVNEALWYRENFEEFYLEIQRHPIPELNTVNQKLLELSTELNIPIVATNDVHYVNREDASTHELLLCVQTNTSIYDEKRMKMAGDFLYLKTPQEMKDLFIDLPEAITNTVAIAEKCHLEIEFNKLHFPQIELPSGKDADSYLAEVCNEGLRRRYREPSPEIKQRLAYELDVVCKTGFPHYFLVVWDIISFARKQNILFNVRGSAAASLVLYCLEVTNIDPLKHKLVFERFLNVERREMPDIDLDFQDNRRNEIIDYVTNKYGADHVAQIITFGTLGARAALRDIGRALGMPYSHVDQVARMVPFGPNMTLEKAMQENRELNDINQQDETVRRLIEAAQKAEGVSRHASTHAAGVVISKEPLTRYLPLQRATKENGQSTPMTQFAMEDVASLGLLKMDFLGLSNLTILANAKEIIARERNLNINLPDIPLDDTKTFSLLSSGETGGVFQLEGPGMRRYIKELKPTTFSDIAAMIALYRPGPMEHIPTFINAKHGLEAVRFPHPALRQILEETYGVIVYQDQVLLIVQALADYTLGEADIFRKAMGKKIPEVMKKEKHNFITRAVKKGVTRELAAEIFNLIEPFAGYAFNKAHSVSYALIAYQTAYLKANYPVEYMTAFLNSYADQTDKVSSAIAECRRLGISVLPPDINNSRTYFVIEKQSDAKSAIRFGLASVKNVGSTGVESILLARSQGGVFKSVEDLCRRADLRNTNKKVLESLIKVGAFDGLGSRGSFLQAIDRILSLAHHHQRLKETGQSSMFDLLGDNVPVPLPGLSLDKADLTLKEKLEAEKDLLGFYFSEHPLANLSSEITTAATVLCGQINAEMIGEKVIIAGSVVSVRELNTRDRRPFAIITLEDLDGTTEVTVWPEVFKHTQPLWQIGNILIIEGTVKQREERITVNCQRVRQHQVSLESNEIQAKSKEIQPVKPVPASLTLYVSHSENEKADILKLQEITEVLRRYPGDSKVYLHVINDDEEVLMEPADILADCRPELIQELTDILGRNNISLE